MAQILEVELVNGDKFTVHPVMLDSVAAERTARVRKWGTVNEARLEYTAFIAFKAAEREGKFEGDYDAFLAQVAGIADSAEVEADPN